MNNLSIYKNRKEISMTIYDVIGKYKDKGITANDFVKELRRYPQAKVINLHISSPGGNVFEALTMYNVLESHEAKVNVYIDGICASAATIIAMAGDTRSMASNGLFMIHRPWSTVIGNRDKFNEEIDRLQKIQKTIVEIYQRKTGLSKEYIAELMKGKDGKDGTYFDAREAKRLGFVTSITGEMKIAALANIENLIDEYIMNNETAREIRNMIKNMKSNIVEEKQYQNSNSTDWEAVSNAIDLLNMKLAFEKSFDNWEASVIKRIDKMKAELRDIKRNRGGYIYDIYG